MKALQFDRFGSPDVIVLRDVPKPAPEGVTGIEIGERVFGPATWDGPTAGAAEYALMAAWARPRPAAGSTAPTRPAPRAARYRRWSS
ncbi:hypothetical protein [Amycolatopsis pithecellobii]|uniref:hypothetical protein n=1 Tax=Amycolatopsis pithecellobii TaxID=664692 RepID=UPI001AA04CBC|nr:hypothetical protein [Amycolatopsis pithecellobii]